MTLAINKICNGVPSYRVGGECRANPKGLTLPPNIYPSERYQVSQEARESYNRHPQLGYKLIRKIPRLTEVAEIIARQQELEKATDFQGDDQAQRLIGVGSKILKLALDYEKLTYSGKAPMAAMAALKNNEKEYGPKLLEAFSRIVESEPEPAAQMAVRKISPKDVALGMVFAKDVYTSNEILLIKAGTKVNPFLFEILSSSSESEYMEETFQVFVSV